jgi:hypothetical protein
MARKTLEHFWNYLGYDGKKINEEKALEVLQEIGVNAKNNRGDTPLIVAATLGNVNVLRLLLTQIDNVDYKVEGTDGESALLNACDQRQLECIKLLVEAGASLEQKDMFGQTPLAKVFTNTFSDPIPSATFLISKGARITDKVIENGRDWDEDRFNEFMKQIQTDQA